MPNANDEQPPQPPPEIRFEIVFNPATGGVTVNNMPNDRILFYGLLGMAQEIGIRKAAETGGLEKQSDLVIPQMGIMRR